MQLIFDVKYHSSGRMQCLLCWIQVLFCIIGSYALNVCLKLSSNHLNKWLN